MNNNKIKKLNDFLIKVLIFLAFIGGYILLPTVFYNILLKINFTSNEVLLQVLANLLYVVLLGGIFFKKVIISLKDFFKNFSVNFEIVIKYWGIGFGLMIVSNLIIVLVFANGSISTNEQINRDVLLSSPYLGMISAVILAPIVEEITFRYSLRGLFKKMIPYASACGLLFGFLHAAADLSEWWKYLYIIPYGSLGFMFACAYYKTRNLVVPICMHMLHNGLVYLLLIMNM